MATIPFEADPQRGEVEAIRERKIKAAMAWLQEAMAGQQKPAAEIEAAGLAAGFTHSTLADARKRLRIRSEKRGNAWWWIPPRTRRKQPATV